MYIHIARSTFFFDHHLCSLIQPESLLCRGYQHWDWDPSNNGTEQGGHISATLSSEHLVDLRHKGSGFSIKAQTRVHYARLLFGYLINRKKKLNRRRFFFSFHKPSPSKESGKKGKRKIKWRLYLHRRRSSSPRRDQPPPSLHLFSL
jgi:hypothetical protein